jgi:hypothetical protein
LLTLFFKFIKGSFLTKLQLNILFSCVFVPVVSAADIVVNASVPLTENSLHETRAIFAKQLSFWPNGEKIKVFILADDHPLHREFTKNNLKMFPHQLRRVWDRMVFSGTGQAPYLVRTEEEMLKKNI